jgi:hypothetical protein
MSVSRQHLSSHQQPVVFDPAALADALDRTCPEVVFALLLGSSRDGHVAVGSDVDVALYVKGKPSFDALSRAADVVAGFAPGVHTDVGFLNQAEPVYRFEAIKGRLLFTRDPEAYQRFFSVTCREYESQLADYERQYRYRRGAA